MTTYPEREMSASACTRSMPGSICGCTCGWQVAADYCVIPRYCVTYFRRLSLTIVSGANLTPEKRDNNPHFVPPQQSSTYNWHLSLFWVSVTYILTRSSITVSRVSATATF